MKPLTIMGIVLTASACSSGGSEGPAFDISANVATFAAEADRVSMLPLVDPAELPMTTGMVRYDGQIVADITSIAGTKAIADLTLNVGFMSDTVDGTIDNIAFLLNNGRSISSDGTISLSGTEMDGAIFATGMSDITSENEYGAVGTSNMEFELNGNIVRDGGRYYTSGDVEAESTGNFDFTIAPEDGDFYAIQEIS